MHTRKIGVKLFYYDKIITRILHGTGGRFLPGCFSYFLARYSIVLSTENM
jgi:hypothetical protein